MQEEIARANGLLAAHRRMHEAVSALLSAPTVPDLERAIIEVLPGATGFERVALFSAPTAERPACVLRSLGYPPLEVAGIGKESPLQAGGFLDAQITGSEDDDRLPHSGVRGSYVLAPLLAREAAGVLLYADTLREEVEPADAAAATAHLLEIAAIIRTNLALVADRERLLAELSMLARTDALTGLPNRRVFEERLESEVRRGARARRSFALAILDLDHFKQINDQYGHPMGDTALRLLADVIRRQARDADFTARLAGDEFALIFVDVDRATVEAAVNRILDAVRCAEMPIPMALSASIGIALSFPVDTSETLVERADNALYASKHAGRDRATFL